MQRPMRHSKREITDHRILEEIIRDCHVLRLAVSRDDHPYMVPVNFGFDGNNFYIHTGLRGMKIEYFEHNPRVCFELERRVAPLPDQDMGCKWTFAYETVIGFGEIIELADAQDRIYGLEQIMQHYSGRRKWPFDQKGLNLVRVWKIKVDSMQGRRAKALLG